MTGRKSRCHGSPLGMLGSPVRATGSREEGGGSLKSRQMRGGRGKTLVKATGRMSSTKVQQFHWANGTCCETLLGGGAVFYERLVEIFESLM